MTFLDKLAADAVKLAENHLNHAIKPLVDRPIGEIVTGLASNQITQLHIMNCTGRHLESKGAVMVCGSKDFEVLVAPAGTVNSATPLHVLTASGTKDLAQGTEGSITFGAGDDWLTVNFNHPWLEDCKVFAQTSGVIRAEVIENTSGNNNKVIVKVDVAPGKVCNIWSRGISQRRSSLQTSLWILPQLS